MPGMTERRIHDYARHGSTGWDRSSACIWLFSSDQRLERRPKTVPLGQNRRRDPRLPRQIYSDDFTRDTLAEHGCDDANRNDGRVIRRRGRCRQ